MGRQRRRRQIGEKPQQEASADSMVEDEISQEPSVGAAVQSSAGGGSSSSSSGALAVIPAPIPGKVVPSSSVAGASSSGSSEKSSSTTAGALVVIPKPRRVLAVGFRPVLPASISRSESRQEGEKNVRPISPSAMVPGGKSLRGRASPCVTPVAERGEEQLGALNGALVVPGPRLPCLVDLSLGQYLELGSDDRLRFWRTAPDLSKKLMVEFLEKRGVVDNIYDEALEYDAANWGLGALKKQGSQSEEQPTPHWPYVRWDLAKYIAEPESRRAFWARAHPTKKAEIARALCSLRERDDVVQEARLEFGAERWGLIVSGRASVVETPVLPPGPDQV